MPLFNSSTEEERNSPEPKPSLTEETDAESQEQRLRFSSSTSRRDLIGCETLSSQTVLGDSGLEADLSALNLYTDDTSDNFVQEPCKVGGGSGAHERIPGLGESPVQACQKRKGKSSKRKEVMMSFGMVKCDGGGRQEQDAKQRNLSKAGEEMEERR